MKFLLILALIFSSTSFARVKARPFAEVQLETFKMIVPEESQQLKKVDSELNILGPFNAVLIYKKKHKFSLDFLLSGRLNINGQKTPDFKNSEETKKFIINAVTKVLASRASLWITPAFADDQEIQPLVDSIHGIYTRWNMKTAKNTLDSDLLSELDEEDVASLKVLLSSPELEEIDVSCQAEPFSNKILPKENSFGANPPALVTIVGKNPDSKIGGKVTTKILVGGDAVAIARCDSSYDIINGKQSAVAVAGSIKKCCDESLSTSRAVVQKTTKDMYGRTTIEEEDFAVYVAKPSGNGTSNRALANAAGFCCKRTYKKKMWGDPEKSCIENLKSILEQNESSSSPFTDSTPGGVR